MGGDIQILGVNIYINIWCDYLLFRKYFIRAGRMGMASTPPFYKEGVGKLAMKGSLDTSTERKILKNLCLGKYDSYLRFFSIINMDIDGERRVMMVEKLERLLKAVKAMIKAFKGATGDNEALIKVLKDEKKALVADSNKWQKTVAEKTAALEDLEKERLAALALIEEIEAELKKA